MSAAWYKDNASKWRAWPAGLCALLLLASPALPPAPIASQAAPVAQAPRPAPAPAAKQPFVLASVLSLPAPLRSGEFAWSANVVPQGKTVIVVDLAAQQLYLYRDGMEVARSTIIYGADEKPTPTGTYPILQKKKHHISNLYFAPMPYMMRLTNDGITLHGSEMSEKYATHGCIGLPNEFAARLFDEVKLGDEVIVTNKWMPQIYWANPDARPKLKPHIVPMI